MRVFECDICGAHYEPCYNSNYDYLKNPDTLEIRNEHTKPDTTYIRHFDICPDCAKAVNELIEARRKPKVSDGGHHYGKV